MSPPACVFPLLDFGLQATRMRILYLDDSGKVHPNDPAKFVVFGGFSVDEGRWRALVRQLNGMKNRFFPRCFNDWSPSFIPRLSMKRILDRSFVIGPPIKWIITFQIV
jgi:hypothetical protein